MSEMRLIDRICFPVLLVSSVAAVVLGLILIWRLEPSDFLGKCVASAIALAVCSGFVMSATRVVAGNKRSDT